MCVDACSNVACQLGFPWQRNIEKVCFFGALDNKAGCRNYTMSFSFQTSPGSACIDLMAVYLFGGSEETARLLLAFNIGIEALYLV